MSGFYSQGMGDTTLKNTSIPLFRDKHDMSQNNYGIFVDLQRKIGKTCGEFIWAQSQRGDVLEKAGNLMVMILVLFLGNC